ncbi:tetratricopeptide repeat protein [Clostridium isatidis]|uniref:tetratricopeptide repeat protein n=1 Tax=Clostridium isatidis TaxID=182773 RepID=UPI003AAE24C7
MKKMEGFFSKIKLDYNKMKTFREKVKKIFNPIYNFFKKVKNIYDKANKRTPYTEPIAVIGSSCLFILILVLVIKTNFTVENVNIITNSAEKFYYQHEYDKAINEYNEMQLNDPWPIWFVNMADIYSLKSEVEKSEALLKESIIVRDRIIKEEGIENYLDKDKNLINKILFIFNMNGKYEETITFGEDYISEIGIDNNILKNLFIAYIIKNHEFKAEETITRFELNENSAYELSEIANMYTLINNWDKALELLDKAWEIDKNELKIYDTIEEMYLFNKEELIKNLERLVNKNNSKSSYKMMLLKAYAYDAENIVKAEKLIEELENDNVEGYIINLIKFETLKNDNNKEAMEYLEKAYKGVKDEKEASFYEYYIGALLSYYNKDYEKASNLVKKSILDNPNYSYSYLLLSDICYSGEGGKFVEPYLRTAMEKSPYSYKIILKMAEYYKNIEVNNVKAKNMYEMAIILRKDNSSLYYELAKLFIAEEQWQEAINSIKKSIEFDNNSNYYRALGALYLKNENYEEAIIYTRKAFEMNDKDILALNNAAWYYINVEKNISRAYENIKAAYEEIPISIDENTKKLIAENYTRIEKLYKENSETLDNDIFMDITLFY